MTDQPVCIFCDSELTPDTKPEHILLSALGGRKTTRRVVCSKQNNAFGGTFDDVLSKQVGVLRNLLQLESGTRKPPPALRDLQAGPDRVNIGSDGKPELVKPPFTVTELPDGNAKVEIHVQSPDAFARVLPHLAAKLRIPEERLIEQLKNGQATLTEMRPGPMHHSLSLGGEEALRSVAKSCLVLLATVAGNEPVKGVPFAEARNYVLHGDTEFNKTRTQIDSRDVPGLDEFKERFGPFFNLIYVRSNGDGRVVGHFTLYNTISWQIVLAESGGPPDVTVALVSNPLDPSTWSDDPTALPDIPFGWLDAAERAYELERARERLAAMMEHHSQRARDAEVSRICDDVFAKHGIMDDNQPITDPEAQKAITGEIIQRLAAHALHLPHEQPLAPEEIEAMLRGKK